jgi:hypothetical protein
MTDAAIHLHRDEIARIEDELGRHDGRPEEDT